MGPIAPRCLAFVALAVLVACQTPARQPEPTGQVAPAPAGQTAPAPTAPQAPASAPAPRPAAPPTSPPAAAPAPAVPQAPEPAAKPPVEAPVRLVVSVPKANLRAEPHTKARILAVLRDGTRLTVVSRGDQWYRVRLENGTEGWVAESVVTPVRE
jgi:uncharacterized protein YgiM (DUF1202 family)